MKQELTDAELNIYARQIVLSDIGYDGQLKLRNATACIVGMGGLGSLIAPKLVGMGIGNLRIVDRDIVSRSDLHRQHLYDVDSVGQPKVEAALKKLTRINPDVNIESYAESLTSYNSTEILSGTDIVLDGLDRPEPRYILNRTCHALKIPYIFGAAIEAFGNITTIVPGRSICLECFMPGLKEEDLPKCGVVGVHPSILGVVTGIQVFEATSVLTAKEPRLLNKLLYIDLREMVFETLSLSREENCPICGVGTKAPYAERLIEETCSRDGQRTFVFSPKERIKIHLNRLSSVLDKSGFEIKRLDGCGITFSQTEDITICILNSGNMIVQASPEATGELKDELLKIYRSILIDGLGFSPNLVPNE